MKYLVLCILFVATSLSAHEKITEAQAKEIFELWGMDQSRDQITGAINTALQKQKAKLNEKQYAILERSYKQVFAEDSIYAGLLNQLREHFDAQHAESALDWLRSPLSRKMVALEKEMAGAEPVENVLPEREKLIKRFISALKPAELIATLMKGSAKGMMQASVVMGGEQVSEKQIDEKLAPVVTMMQQMFDGMLPGLYAAGYQSVTDAELTKYIEFLESATGKSLQEASMRSISGTMADRFGRSMIVIGAEVKKAKN